ncbi:MAG: hypothetical protein IPL54_10795 [Chitinophagaceae bacterium]|nr:hypothetical protein [Chitinophagaceae bacterium]
MIPDNTKWKATALLFSGRQNPDWELTVEQQQSWMKLWEQAAVSNIAVEQPSILGYTGCKLQYDEHSHWQLYNGCVSFMKRKRFFLKKMKEGRWNYFCWVRRRRK